MFVWMESLTTSLEPCVYAVSYIFQIYLSFPWIEREEEMIHSTDLRPFNEPIHGNKLLMHSRYDFACVCAGFFLSLQLFSRLVATIFHDFCKFFSFYFYLSFRCWLQFFCFGGFFFPFSRAFIHNGV